MIIVQIDGNRRETAIDPQGKSLIELVRHFNAEGWALCAPDSMWMSGRDLAFEKDDFVVLIKE